MRVSASQIPLFFCLPASSSLRSVRSSLLLSSLYPPYSQYTPRRVICQLFSREFRKIYFLPRTATWHGVFPRETSLSEDRPNSSDYPVALARYGRSGSRVPSWDQIAWRCLYARPGASAHYCYTIATRFNRTLWPSTVLMYQIYYIIRPFVRVCAHYSIKPLPTGWVLFSKSQ